MYNMLKAKSVFDTPSCTTKDSLKSIQKTDVTPHVPKPYKMICKKSNMNNSSFTKKYPEQKEW